MAVLGRELPTSPPKVSYRDWQMLQERKSPNDTTSWDEIPEAWA